MKKINKIIVHCSDSNFGNTNILRDWHVNGNGWKDIGYHFVICNGYEKKGELLEFKDGMIESGRALEVVGSHARGHNTDSIGICLIGTNTYTDKQMLSLKILLSELMVKYKLKPENIFGHRELDRNKTCPTSLDLDALRASL